MRNAILRAIARIAERKNKTEYENRTYEFGGLYLKACWNSRLPIAPALEMIRHRQVENAKPSATIEIIAGSNPDLEEVLPPLSARGERALLSDGRIYYFWTPEGAGSLTAFDRETRQGFVSYLALDSLGSWETSRPLLQTIKALSLDASWVPVHAAAVALHGRGLLLTGPGKVGKSSTALACVEVGWKYIGDDFLLLDGRPVEAKNLFASARVREDMFSRLPRAVSIADYLSHDSGEIKAEVNMAKLPNIEIGNAVLRAIIIPQRTGSTLPAISPIRRSTALRALAATTLINLPGDPVATHQKIENFVNELPCYMLDPGASLAETAKALAQFVEMA